LHFKLEFSIRSGFPTRVPEIPQATPTRANIAEVDSERLIGFDKKEECLDGFDLFMAEGPQSIGKVLDARLASVSGGSQAEDGRFGYLGC
jgi:hypothetical protein